MRDYAKLSPFFWARGSGKKLRGDATAQVIAFYLSTSPAANMVGIYYVSLATIANDTGHPIDAVREALMRVELAGYAFYDFEAELAWIPNHARFEIGPEMTPGDKRRKKVVAELAQVDGHPFGVEFRSLYGAAYGLGYATFPTGPPPQVEPHPPPDPNPEGASGDREQIRTDQIRTDQGRERARDGRMRRDLPFEPDARTVFEALTLTREAGKPCEDVWSDFCGHHATQDFGSREAVLGRWQKWVNQQCVIADKERMRERDRRDQAGQRSGPRLIDTPRAPYHAPFVPAEPSEEPASLELASEALRKLTGALV